MANKTIPRITSKRTLREIIADMGYATNPFSPVYAGDIIVEAVQKRLKKRSRAKPSFKIIDEIDEYLEELLLPQATYRATKNLLFDYLGSGPRPFTLETYEKLLDLISSPFPGTIFPIPEIISELVREHGLAPAIERFEAGKLRSFLIVNIFDKINENNQVPHLENVGFTKEEVDYVLDIRELARSNSFYEVLADTGYQFDIEQLKIVIGLVYDQKIVSSKALKAISRQIWTAVVDDKLVLPPKELSMLLGFILKPEFEYQPYTIDRLLRHLILNDYKFTQEDLIAIIGAKGKIPTVRFNQIVSNFTLNELPDSIRDFLVLDTNGKRTVEIGNAPEELDLETIKSYLTNLFNGATDPQSKKLIAALKSPPFKPLMEELLKLDKRTLKKITAELGSYSIGYPGDGLDRRYLTPELMTILNEGRLEEVFLECVENYFKTNSLSLAKDLRYAPREPNGVNRKKPFDDVVDFVIVGTGPAAIACAQGILEVAPNAEILFVEKAKHVGGQFASYKRLGEKAFNTNQTTKPDGKNLEGGKPGEKYSLAPTGTVITPSDIAIAEGSDGIGISYGSNKGPAISCAISLMTQGKVLLGATASNDTYPSASGKGRCLEAYGDRVASATITARESIIFATGLGPRPNDAIAAGTISFQELMGGYIAKNIDDLLKLPEINIAIIGNGDTSRVSVESIVGTHLDLPPNKLRAFFEKVTITIISPDAPTTKAELCDKAKPRYDVASSLYNSGRLRGIKATVFSAQPTFLTTYLGSQEFNLIFDGRAPILPLFKGKAITDYSLTDDLSARILATNTYAIGSGAGYSPEDIKLKWGDAVKNVIEKLPENVAAMWACLPLATTLGKKLGLQKLRRQSLEL